MLDQRRRRWGDVVYMLYKYFAGYAMISAVLVDSKPGTNHKLHTDHNEDITKSAVRPQKRREGNVCVDRVSISASSRTNNIMFYMTGRRSMHL